MQNTNKTAAEQYRIPKHGLKQLARNQAWIDEEHSAETDSRTVASKLQLVQYDLPAYWASYLINGDESGIEDKDQYEADKFLAEHNLPSPVSCEPAGIGRFNGLMCDLETYSFLI